MKIDFSRLDALRPTAAVPEGFEPVPEAETPFDSGYEAMYRAAWDFHLETDDRLRAAAGEAREAIWLRAAAAMGEKVAASVGFIALIEPFYQKTSVISRLFGFRCIFLPFSS